MSAWDLNIVSQNNKLQTRDVAPRIIAWLLLFLPVLPHQGICGYGGLLLARAVLHCKAPNVSAIGNVSRSKIMIHD
jgi:hypothetical protein